MNKRQLKRKIEKQLGQLEELLNQIDEARVINSDDSDTWDSDALYDLKATCEAVTKLLEDKQASKERNSFGEPLILEEGLCSLVDEYTSEEEDE